MVGFLDMTKTNDFFEDETGRFYAILHILK